MGSLKYCDNDCINTENDCPMYEPNDNKVAEALVLKKWAYHKYDLHFCKSCIEDYFNEDGENLKIVGNYFTLGKDFKTEGE